MREENQLRIILNIIEEYKLDEPLSRFLKKYFQEHPNMGSQDRRTASSFVYNYFRLGKAIFNAQKIDRIILGSFLTSEKSNSLLKYCLENFSNLNEEDIILPLKEKEKIAQCLAPDFKVE